MAALITVWIVVPTLHPAAPIVARLQYADRYASQPGFKPGSVISNDHEADALVNVMTSLVGLKYPRRFIVNVAFYYGGRPDSLASKFMMPDFRGRLREISNRSFGSLIPCYASIRQEPQ